jgi:hypothetical protein
MNKKLLAFALVSLLTSGLYGTVALADEVTVSANVGCYKTATFNYDAVSYGPMSTGDTNVTAPNQADGVYNVTMDTNCNYKVSASGTDFSTDGHSFDISNLWMQVNSSPTFSIGSAVQLSTGPQDIATGFTPSDTTNYHGFWLSIPSSQFGGSYSSTVTITLANA